MPSAHSPNSFSRRYPANRATPRTVPRSAPVVVLNLKTYPVVFGSRGIGFLRAAQNADQGFHGRLVLCPPAFELARYAALAKAPVDVFAQHADADALGAHTGGVPLASLPSLGVSGTLLNHAERKIPHGQVRSLISLARKLRVDVIACAKDDAEAAVLARLSPFAVAVEPPALIETGISVSTAKPDVVRRSVERIRRVNPRVKVLVGAGISRAADVRRSLELGADGVLLASAFVKSRSPGAFLKSLLRATRA